MPLAAFSASDIEAFVRDARRLQKKSQTPLKSKRHLSPHVKDEIRKAAREIPARPKGHATTRNDAITMMETFEEMCRRNKVEINPVLRPLIFKHLVSELEKNRKDLGVKASRVLHFTAINGATAECLIQKFPFFSKRRSVFVYVAQFHASNAEEILTLAQQNIAAFLKESQDKNNKLSVFASSPSIFFTAAFYNPADPRGFLLGVIKTVEDLTQESKDPASPYAFFADAVWLFKHAATRYPSDPRKFLLGVKERAEKMLEESQSPNSEFYEWRDKKGAFIFAAAMAPRNPEKRLRKTLREYGPDRPRVERHRRRGKSPEL